MILVSETRGAGGFLAGCSWLPFTTVFVPAVLLLIRKARLMATYTLDQLRADVEKNYASLRIEVGTGDVIEVRNLLRMEQGQRDKLLELLDQIETASDKEDSSGPERLSATIGLTRKALSMAAGSRGDDLLALVGDDDALVMDIMAKWMESTEVGEAEGSSD